MRRWTGTRQGGSGDVKSAGPKVLQGHSSGIPVVRGTGRDSRCADGADISNRLPVSHPMNRKGRASSVPAT